MLFFVDVVTDLGFFVSSQILDAGYQGLNSGTGENLVGSGLTNTIKHKSDQPRSASREADQHQQYVP